MTVSELIKALADFSPTSEVRVKPSLDSCGDKVERVYGIEGSLSLGSVVFIVKEGV